MNRRVLAGGLLILTCWLQPIQGRGQDIGGIIGSGITRVIRAVDLQIQRIQTRTILLEEAQRAIENTLSALSLDEIRSWVQAQKDLYDDYFQELFAVKNVIARYRRVEAIIQRQEQIVRRYGQIKAFVSTGPPLNAVELEYLEKSCSSILSQSVSNLSELSSVVTSFSLQMSDEQRIAIIDEVATKTDGLYRSMDRIGNQAALLQLQKMNEAGEIDLWKKLYGL